MTLQQAKDKFASPDYESWNDMIQHGIIDIKSKPEFYSWVEKYFTEAAEIYASSQSEALKEKTIQEVIDLFKPLFEIEPKAENIVQIALKVKDIYAQIERLKIDLKG